MSRQGRRPASRGPAEVLATVLEVDDLIRVIPTGVCAPRAPRSGELGAPSFPGSLSSLTAMGSSGDRNCLGHAGRPGRADLMRRRPTRPHAPTPYPSRRLTSPTAARCVPIGLCPQRGKGPDDAAPPTTKHALTRLGAGLIGLLDYHRDWKVVGEPRLC
jgi:hypothetical protein